MKATMLPSATPCDASFEDHTRRWYAEGKLRTAPEQQRVGRGGTEIGLDWEAK
jgi:hypothetical protein